LDQTPPTLTHLNHLELISGTLGGVVSFILGQTWILGAKLGLVRSGPIQYLKDTLVTEWPSQHLAVTPVCFCRWLLQTRDLWLIAPCKFSIFNLTNIVLEFCQPSFHNLSNIWVLYYDKFNVWQAVDRLSWFNNDKKAIKTVILWFLIFINIITVYIFHW
jgi:hypothetical protein